MCCGVCVGRCLFALGFTRWRCLVLPPLPTPKKANFAVTGRPPTTPKKGEFRRDGPTADPPMQWHALYINSVAGCIHSLNRWHHLTPLNHRLLAPLPTGTTNTDNWHHAIICPTNCRPVPTQRGPTMLRVYTVQCLHTTTNTPPPCK